MGAERRAGYFILHPSEWRRGRIKKGGLYGNRGAEGVFKEADDSARLCKVNALDLVDGEKSGRQK